MIPCLLGAGTPGYITVVNNTMKDKPTLKQDRLLHEGHGHAYGFTIRKTINAACLV